MKRPRKPDIRDVRPTIVILDAKLTFNGGTLSSDQVGKVWIGMLKAFEKIAHEQGLGCTWMGELGCQRPEVMQRRIERLQLNIEKPPSTNAVDPVVPSSVEPSTRDSKSSSPARAALLDPAPPGVTELEIDKADLAPYLENPMLVLSDPPRLDPAPPETKEEDVSRVEPLKAGVDGQDLPQSRERE